jgi:MFS family permease
MEHKKTSSYADFFRTKGNRYRLAVLLSLGIFSQWSGNAIISNYVSILYDTAGVTDSNKKLGLSGGTTGLALVVSVTMAMLVDKVGRRPMFLASTGGMFVMFIFWTLTSGLYDEQNAPGANYAMIVFIWLFGIMYSLAWSGLLVGYAIELLPYKLRAKGLMILNVAIQAALTLNVYANPIAFDYFVGHTWKFYLIYTVCLRISHDNPPGRPWIALANLFVPTVLDPLRVYLCLLHVRRDPGPNSRRVVQGHRWRRGRRCPPRPSPTREGGANQRC